MAHIRQVTDLRSGLLHPKRDWDGRFISRKEAALLTLQRNRILDGVEREYPSSIYMFIGLVNAWTRQALK